MVADANGSWRLQHSSLAVRMLENLSRRRLEQRCPTIEECIILRDRTSKPFVLDEVITDVTSLLRCQQAGVMVGVNLKITRIGWPWLAPSARWRRFPRPRRDPRRLSFSKSATISPVSGVPISSQPSSPATG